jgi:hypothetical protein
MWVVEINILGRRFTREVHDRRAAFPITTRTLQSGLTHLRHMKPRAAA